MKHNYIQKNDKKALENSYKDEVKELISKWDNLIMPNFENEVIIMEVELKKKH